MLTHGGPFGGGCGGEIFEGFFRGSEGLDEIEGLGRRDDSALVTFYERWAGKPVSDGGAGE